MIDLVTVAQMSESDEAAIRGGIPAGELMARAAKGVLEAYPWRGRVAIVCGAGNNAGDGYDLALLLRERGIDCRVLRLSAAVTPVAREFLDGCLASGIPVDQLSVAPDFSGDREIVDCLFGTGFRGSAEGLYAETVNAMNESGLPVVSVDVNSGLNGDSGLGSPAVRSALTVSVGTRKTGHYLGRAKDLVGKLVNADVGIPILGDPIRLLEPADLRAVIPPRAHHSNKGTYGYVGILGGCVRYAGAAKLANLGAAALRSGCGVVTLGVPASLAPAVAPYLLESTLAPLPEREGYLTYDPAALDEFLAGKRAVAVGMGWGRSQAYPAILTHILERFSGSILLDADALNTLSGMDRSLLKRAVGRVVVTPHPKEFERLSGRPVDAILADPVGAAKEFAAAYGAVVLLKGTATVVTDGNDTYLSDRGGPGMATAGSGDVLSGVLCGLLGYLPPSALTVACGATLAGMAGEAAEREQTAVGMVASDTVRAIPQVLREILS